MAYLFDTNTFVRLAEQHSPMREAVLNAIRKLRQSGEKLCYAPQVLAEFWNVCTRPRSARGGLAIPVDRVDQKARLIEKYFELLPDNLATFNEWRRLVADLKIAGVQVHDAKLVSTMLVHGVPNLVTFNTEDFRRFPIIRAIHPSDV